MTTGPRRGRFAAAPRRPTSVGALRACRHIVRSAPWTPYDGCAVTGWPVHTVVHGQIAVRDGALNGQPAGQIATFPDTAAQPAAATGKPACRVRPWRHRRVAPMACLAASSNRLLTLHGPSTLTSGSRRPHPHRTSRGRKPPSSPNP
ncbi:hypothetical protein DM992_24290 [Burkholderia sp. JP2-270]|nr:hypothetical protein DM992_24290 [Burkholderia sp. JP2-270]